MFFENFNRNFEPVVIRLRPDSTFLTRTAKQFGVRLPRQIVPKGALYPTVGEMEADLVEDLGEALFPEDGE